MKRPLIPMTLIALLFLSAAATFAQGEQCLFGGFPDETNTSCQYHVGIDIALYYPRWIEGYDFALQPVQDFLLVTRDEFWNYAIESLNTMFNRWFLQIDYEEYAFSDNVRSILFTVGGYSGGAHPYSYYQTFTFDLAGQRQVTLMDMFQPNSDPLAVIAPLVEQDLLAQMVDFADAQWIEDGTGTNPDNYQRFVLTDEALIFFFDPYQVAPYAAGPFEVSIPLGNISSILAPEFPAVG
jgi:hypothetical protein